VPGAANTPLIAQPLRVLVLMRDLLPYWLQVHTQAAGPWRSLHQGASRLKGLMTTCSCKGLHSIRHQRAGNFRALVLHGRGCWPSSQGPGQHPSPVRTAAALCL